MASGNFYKEFHTSNPKYKLIVDWGSTPTTSTNSSVVTATIKLYCPYGLYIGAREDNTIVINGTTYYYDSSAISTSGGNTYTLGTVTSNAISHNSDGTKTISITCNFQLNATLSSTYYGKITASSNSIVLDTIARASTITSASNVTLGNKCSIVFTPASTTYQYNIKFSLGNWSVDTGKFKPGQTSAYTYNAYTIPNTEAVLSQIPSSTTATMTATLTTYNSSGTQIGSTSSKTFTVTVPNGVVPTVGTITLTPQTYSYLIQGKNTVKVSVSGCSAGTGSSIKSYTFSGPGVSSTTTSTSVTSSTISASGTLTYTVKVTDNRGRTAQNTASITCYAYSAPSITFNAYRVTSSTSTTEDDNGTYVRCTYNLAYSSVNSTNDVTVKIYYKKSSVGSWSSQTVLTDSKNTSGSYTLSGIDADSTYLIYATITDNYGGNSPSTQTTIFGASRILNITKDGTGVAFGKMAESTKLLESRYRIKSPGIASRRGTRPVDANTSYETEGEEDYLGTMEHYLSSNQMTANKPTSGNGHIIHCHWDVADTAGDSQLFLHASTGEIQSRGCSSGTWNDWRTSLDSVNYTSYVSPKPITLFSSSVGISGTVTLSSSAANFAYFEIFLYKDGVAGWWSVKVPSPDGKKVQVGTQYYANSSNVGLQLIGKTINISGTTITSNDEFYMNFNKSTGALANIGTQNTIKIMRVLGYK